MLAFGYVGRIADISGERIYVAQQVRSERQPAAIGSLRGARVKGQLTGTMGIAGHSEIHCVAQIGPELRRMIAMLVRHVTYPLEFVFLLIQRAITGVCRE